MRAIPVVAVRAEGIPRTRMRPLGNMLLEDALGAFRLRTRGRLETGSTLGVWIVIGGEMAWFQPQPKLVEKAYLK